MKLGVKLPLWVCHDRSACGNFSVGVAWHQWVCLGLSDINDCGLALLSFALHDWEWNVLTGFGIHSMVVGRPQ